MKRKNDNLLIEIVEKIAFVLFVVSIYLAIRWSDFKVIKCVLFDNSVFIHSEGVDAVLLSIVTGYFSGYLVYIFTVVIPTRKKRQIAMEQAGSRLIAIYNEFVYTLLLMAKSAANEDEWNYILAHDSDLNCFDSKFYSIIRKFDIMCPAETLLKRVDENKNRVNLFWYEYLEMKAEKWYKEIDDVMLYYQLYMADGLVQCLYRIKTNSFFELILGKGIGMSSVYESEDGIEYYENLPIAMFCNQAKDQVKPIFSVNQDGIKNCVCEFSKLYLYVKKYIKDKRIESDCSLGKFKKHNIGHIGTASVVKNIEKVERGK